MINFYLNNKRIKSKENLKIKLFLNEKLTQEMKKIITKSIIKLNKKLN